MRLAGGVESRERQGKGGLTHNPYRYTGESAAHLAAMLPDEEKAKSMLKLLIQNGADVNTPIVKGQFFLKEEKGGSLYFGDSVLSFAACTHKIEIVRVLTQGVIDPEDGFVWPTVDINRVDHNGMNASCSFFRCISTHTGLQVTQYSISWRTGICHLCSRR